MDTLELLLGAKVKWSHDKIKTLAQIQPRHLGRIAKFEYFESDEDDYNSVMVMGRFDGVSGDNIIIANADYRWGRVADLTIWRSELG